jgi:hypothetical protein
MPTHFMASELHKQNRDLRQYLRIEIAHVVENFAGQFLGQMLPLVVDESATIAENLAPVVCDRSIAAEYVPHRHDAIGQA